MNYNYITDFHKSRKNRIGASDVPWLVPHPEIQIESLAAYTDSKGKRQHCTALDLYDEKISPAPWEYNFPADMGHRLEGYALYEFIADNIDKDIAFEFSRNYQLHKIQTQNVNILKIGRVNECVNPEPYNNTPFKHNTEAKTNYGVAHADCVYDPDKKYTQDLPVVHHLKKLNGLTIDLSKPFIIEAKSARLYTVNARKNDKYKGFDLTLKTWQGIPLKVYFQIQYQMALYNIDTAYLSLIFDTSQKYYWQIKANKKHQRELIQIAEYMKQCIDTKTPPKKLLMNSKDISKLFPETKEDFREVQGEELTEILDIAKIQRHAASQEKAWKRKKQDADERLSLHLKDTEMLKGIVNGTLQTIGKWKKTGGGLYIQGLSEIEKREDGKRIKNYLEKNKLIKEKNTGRKPSVVIQESELEGIE